VVQDLEMFKQWLAAKSTAKGGNGQVIDV